VVVARYRRRGSSKGPWFTFFGVTEELNQGEQKHETSKVLANMNPGGYGGVFFTGFHGGFV